MYVGVRVSLAGYETKVISIPLELNDFDVILGIDWLSKHMAQVDCYTKTITFQRLEGRKVVFKGERISIPINLVSIVIAGKLHKKGCVGHLVYVLNSNGGELRLSDILVIREFLNVFPEELRGLPPDRKVEVSINTFPEVPPIAQPSYN
jgi:hypothetical protein